MITKCIVLMSHPYIHTNIHLSPLHIQTDIFHSPLPSTFLLSLYVFSYLFLGITYIEGECNKTFCQHTHCPLSLSLSPFLPLLSPFTLPLSLSSFILFYNSYLVELICHFFLLFLLHNPLKNFVKFGSLRYSFKNSLSWPDGCHTLWPIPSLLTLFTFISPV